MKILLMNPEGLSLLTYSLGEFYLTDLNLLFKTKPPPKPSPVTSLSRSESRCQSIANIHHQRREVWYRPGDCTISCIVSSYWNSIRKTFDFNDYSIFIFVVRPTLLHMHLSNGVSKMLSINGWSHSVEVAE